MSSYLLYEPNYVLRVFTTTLELQFHILDPRDKIVQNTNFSYVSQNNTSSLKLNFTRQHVSRGMFSFQNRASNVKILKFRANQDNNVYLEKYDFSTKTRLLIVIRFMILKQVSKWFQILISGFGLPALKRRQILSGNFHSLFRKI